MTSIKESIGAWGEAFAADYLESLGWVILDRNWRCELGELDLVACDDTDDRLVLVAVEVKTRTGTGFGHPLAAITHAKGARLRRLLATWCAENGGYFQAVRVDAVGIIKRPGRVPQVDHVRGIE